MWGVYIKFPLPTKQNKSGTATGISSTMGGPHSPELLAPYRMFNPLTSTRPSPYCNQACNGGDQLLNHLCFHYQMVLVCPICAGSGSSSWRTIKSHIKACAQQQPLNTAHRVQPRKPLWQSSNNRLKGLTRVKPTATSFELPTWTDTPYDNKVLDTYVLRTLSKM